MNYERIEAVNWSLLREMETSPRALRWRADHPREDTPTLRLGRAVHCAILEPDEYAARYLIRPSHVDARTAAGKAWLVEAAERGVDVLTAAESETVAECAAAVLDHRVASALLAGTRREVPLIWTDPATGLDCKARLDAVGLGGQGDTFGVPRVVDLKTTRDLGAFARGAARYLYHGQLAWYLDAAITAGLVPEDAQAYLVAVESVGPYDVACWRVGAEALAAGRALWRRLLGLYAECQRAGEWPGAHETIEVLELPPWAAGVEGEEW